VPVHCVNATLMFGTGVAVIGAPTGKRIDVQECGQPLTTETVPGLPEAVAVTCTHGRKLAVIAAGPGGMVNAMVLAVPVASPLHSRKVDVPSLADAVIDTVAPATYQYTSHARLLGVCVTTPLLPGLTKSTVI